MKSRVLIVEEFPTQKQFLEKTLLENDLEIISTDSGEEAINLLRLHTDIKLIIADILLPGISGQEFKQTVKDIPIILVTENLRHTERGIELNPYVILTKPVDPADLNQIVVNHFYKI